MARLRNVVASHQKEVSPERESADEAALAWLVRLTSGESTPEDHDRFRDWRDESPRHAEALHRARMLWTTLGSTIPAIEHNRVRSLARRRLVQRALAIAASIALVVGLGLHYRQVWQYDEVTGTGEHRHLVLSDGSRVLLGAGAALSEHFDNAERRLTLARGQAYFEVRHDARRPFVVTAGAGEIRDIGTSFTVALGEDRARAFVVNGVVEASRGRQRLRLIAGQSVEISRSGVGPVSSADMAVATAWMRRKLLLSNRPLTEIITAMAPYYSRRIVLLNRAAAETPMSAAIDLDEKGVEEWLAALERSGTVRLLHLPGIVVLR